MERKTTFFARGLVLVSMVFIAVLCRQPMMVKAQDVSLEVGEKVSYMGYSTNYFYVDGNLAYCLEPAMGTPGDGIYDGTELDADGLLGKAMYYVYGGPGYEAYMKPSLTGGWEDNSRAYCLSHCILSYIYDDCDAESDAFLGLNEDIIDAVKMYTEAINDWPDIPGTEISLSGSDYTTYFNEEEECQRTETITCSGDSANSLDLKLPDGVTLVNETKGTRDEGEVKVYGGDNFYLCADVTFGNGITWESGEMYGEITQAWRTLVVMTGEKSQDVGSASMKTVETAPVFLNVKWLEKPELQVDKKADKAEKTYKLGDVITYTVDVTQQIKNAVAKNVKITDTILTEGVKLQKNSIVLMDENQNVLSGVNIAVHGNSYTIDAGQFLKGIDTCQKYTVEYQVAITDESVIGKEIENEVVVRADNAEEQKDREKVKVEVPKEPETEEPDEPEEPKAPEENKVHEEPQIVAKAVPVKTGDNANVLTFLMIMLISGICILRLDMRSKRK